MIIKRRVLGSMLDFELTYAELEEAYREHERQYLMEDAIRQCEENDHANADETDYNALIELFMKHKDCNRADNDVWEEIINRYFNEKHG